jgi:hypothetical protein
MSKKKKKKKKSSGEKSSKPKTSWIIVLFAWLVIFTVLLFVVAPEKGTYVLFKLGLSDEPIVLDAAPCMYKSGENGMAVGTKVEKRSGLILSVQCKDGHGGIHPVEK